MALEGSLKGRETDEAQCTAEVSEVRHIHRGIMQTPFGLLDAQAADVLRETHARHLRHGLRDIGAI